MTLEGWAQQIHIYLINTLSPSVTLSLCDSVCPIAYSSETIGARDLTFWIMLDNILGVVLIYILNDFIDYFFFQIFFPGNKYFPINPSLPCKCVQRMRIARQRLANNLNCNNSDASTFLSVISLIFILQNVITYLQKRKMPSYRTDI